MSEWLDSQKQLIRNLFKLISDEIKRLNKLEVIADKPNCRENMRNHELQIVVNRRRKKALTY